MKQIGRHVRVETLSPRFQRITIPLQARIKSGLAVVILKSVASHKRVEIDHLIDTL
jgi:hypothetical protein